MIRIMRVLKHFSSLRVIIYGVLSSGGLFAWILIILGFEMSGTAIILAYGTPDNFHGSGATGAEDDVSVMLREWYPNLISLIGVLFQAITGGMDCREVSLHWNM